MGLKVLVALDQAKIQFYHFKAIIVAGMGLFTDAYDLFCINPVMKLIGRIYYEPRGDNPGVVPPTVATAVLAVTLVGTVIGNLVFGTLGDRIGRRRVYGFSLLLMVFASFASAFSIGSTRGCVLSSLCFFRFLLGIGIGGDYPLSATIMSEFANKRTRGSFIAAVFSMQGFGILASSITTMTVVAVFHRATDNSDISPLHTPWAADLAWRIIVMIGAVPAALTFYWRMSMPETARYTALVEHDEIKAANDMKKVLEDINLQMIVRTPNTLPWQPSLPSPTYSFFSKQFLTRHGRDLFACSMAWFLVDIPYYSSTLFQSQILGHWIHDAKDVNAYVEAYDVAKSQAIIAITSTIPGYFATVFFIDRIGRRKIQMMGFFFMAIFIFALAGPYNKYWNDHTNAWFIILYGLTFFFSNFGPNTTTFIVPAELFPARFRSTCYGISGAVGKIGAIIGAIGFLWASQERNRKKLKGGWKPGIGMMNALLILGGVCIIGMVLTYFYTNETKMRSLEENEDWGNQHKGNDVEINGVELRRNTSNASQFSSQPLFGCSPLSSSL